MYKSTKFEMKESYIEQKYQELCKEVFDGYKRMEPDNKKEADKINIRNIGAKNHKIVPYMRAYGKTWEQPLDEINLWAERWQGKGVRHPRIMLIGQDWGCPFEEEHDFVTDNNISILFKEIDDKYTDLKNEKYDDLFFTNLILGYRSSGASGSFRTHWITCIERKVFPELVELLDPKIIICLGKNTYEQYSIIMDEPQKASLSGKSAVGMDIGGFNKYIETYRNNPKVIKGIPTFCFAHPGAMGVLNRNAVYKDIDGKRKKETKAGLQLNMIEDWKCAGNFLKEIEAGTYGR